LISDKSAEFSSCGISQSKWRESAEFSSCGISQSKWRESAEYHFFYVLILGYVVLKITDIVLPLYHTYYEDDNFFSVRIMQSMKMHLPHDFDQNS
jgi:hypothetical protein